MKTKMITLALMVLLPLPLWAIGFVYSGVGGGRREFMELTETTVQVQIQDRVALTRTDQVFTNRSGQIVEGIYEFKLPVGAIITNLVLWIEGRPVKGIIMEKEEGRRAYDAVVRRRIDPALIEQINEENFRLSIFPFPPQGSRRVELEYMQVLEARNGTINYTFPLAPETDLRVRMERFILRADIKGQHPFTVQALGVPQQIVEIRQPDERSAQILFADEELVAEENLRLTLRESGTKRLPTVMSYPPINAAEMGYYALWLPPLQELAQADPLPRSLTFVIDISSSMQGGRLKAVKAALTAAIEELHDEDLFNVVVFSNGAETFARTPMEATAANKEQAIRYVNRQGALGVTNFEAAFAAAFEQDFPAGRANQTIFLTDGHATLGETEPLRLSEIVADMAPPGLRLFAIGVGNEVNRGFLRVLADDYQGEARFVVDEQGIEEELRILFSELARPVFMPKELTLSGTQVHDLFPRDVSLLARGQEFFQVGRYEVGGDFNLRLEGMVHDQVLSLEYPLALTRSDTSLPLIPRLWAHQKVQALEALIDRYGTNQELLDDILALGLTYRLVTRRTSLFAPDDNVVVSPEFGEDQADGTATAIEETTVEAIWLGREFHLRDEVWVDVQFDLHMSVELYEGKTGQPGELLDFARLGQDMIVVVGERAYKISQSALPPKPVLSQNAPNPFNASTIIRFQIPANMEITSMQLAIYNLMGQLVRDLPLENIELGENQVTWDGRNSRGQEVASGVYIYRLSGGGSAVSRRMLLLR